jgi:hypothetical protein
VGASLSACGCIYTHAARSRCGRGLEASVGVLHVLVAQVVKWDINRMPKEKLPALTGSIVFQPGYAQTHTRSDTGEEAALGLCGRRSRVG